MGFNTVAFFLNDVMHILAKSPKTLTWALTHPPHGGEIDRRSWKQQVYSIAVEAGEPPITEGMLDVLPTFHADARKWLVAGNNQIEELKFVRYSKTGDGKKTVVLELPNYWQGYGKWVRCPFTWLDEQRRAQQCSLLVDHDNAHQCDHEVPHINCGAHAPLAPLEVK